MMIIIMLLLLGKFLLLFCSKAVRWALVKHNLLWTYVYSCCLTVFSEGERLPHLSPAVSSLLLPFVSSNNHAIVKNSISLTSLTRELCLVFCHTGSREQPVGLACFVGGIHDLLVETLLGTFRALLVFVELDIVSPLGSFVPKMAEELLWCPACCLSHPSPIDGVFGSWMW